MQRELVKKSKDTKMEYAKIVSQDLGQSDNKNRFDFDNQWKKL